MGLTSLINAPSQFSNRLRLKPNEMGGACRPTRSKQASSLGGRPRVLLSKLDNTSLGRAPEGHFIECEKELVRTMHLLAIINATTDEERDIALETYEARYAGRLNKPLIATP